MRYQCIRCLTIWGDRDSEDGFMSHGLCKKCLKEGVTQIYRKRQLNEGHFDCFAKSDNFCDQTNCSYRNICLG